MHMAKDAAEQPEHLTLPPMDPEKHRFVVGCVNKFLSTPPDQLPPELRMVQRQNFEMQEPLNQLRAASMESLSPELQDLKRRIAEKDAKEEGPFGAKEVEQRMADLMISNGEQPLPFNELD